MPKLLFLLINTFRITLALIDKKQNLGQNISTVEEKEHKSKIL
jgi:hypothetical protein